MLFGKRENDMLNANKTLLKPSKIMTKIYIRILIILTHTVI